MINIVRLYTLPTCHYCNALKDFLKEHHINFEDVDVSKDEEIKKLIIEKTGQLGVPVIEINGEFIPGFDKEKLSNLLNIK